MATTKTYTDRSNCRRAAKKAFGEDAAFEIIAKKDGTFTFRAIETAEESLPASRFPKASESRIDDQTPGFKRLRKSTLADEIRAATLDDQAEGREEASARIEAEKATKPAEAPAPVAFKMVEDKVNGGKHLVRKPADPAPKAGKAAPKEGTISRRIFDMLCRESGATAKECTEAGLKGVSVKAYAVDFAKSFPHLEAICEKEGSADRCRLAPKAAVAA